MLKACQLREMAVFFLVPHPERSIIAAKKRLIQICMDFTFNVIKIRAILKNLLFISFRLRKLNFTDMFGGNFRCIGRTEAFLHVAVA